MGVLTAIRRSKVAAVIISVFDWYRKFPLSSETRRTYLYSTVMAFFSGLTIKHRHSSLQILGGRAKAP